MKREPVDYWHVEDHQIPVHKRLVNWASWVRPRPPWWQHPMWRWSRSNARQWHQPVLRDPIDSLDAVKVEKTIAALPMPNKQALRWCYVFCSSPHKIRRQLGLSESALQKLLRDSRQMLVNLL